MAAADQLTSLMALIQGVQGKSSTTKTSGGTTTTQANVSDAGVNQLLNQILSGSGGVKDIGTRARASGLYNSTTEQSLLGNLYSTAANQAELARTPTTTTTSGTTSKTTQAGTGAGTLLGTIGGGLLASTALNALSPVISKASNSVGSAISDLLGLSGGSSDSGSSLKGLFDNISVGGASGGNITGNTTGISTGEGYGLNTSSLGSFGNSSSGLGSGFSGLNFGFNTDTGDTSANVSTGGLGALGGLAGNVISGLLGASGGGSGTSSGTGNGTMGSVICTALEYRGLLDAKLYALGSAYLKSLPMETKIGYHSWAIPIAAKIKAGDKKWTTICLPFARSRTALLATSGSIVDHVRYPLGSITKFVGEPICNLIGRAMLHKACKEFNKTVKGV